MLLAFCSFVAELATVSNFKMGSSLSIISHRRSKLLRQENVRLEARIERMYKETSQLKAEIQDIVQAKEVAVQRSRFGVELPQCLLTNGK